MKLKAIFLLLNAVIVAAFLAIFLMPLFLLGGDWFAVFWAGNWPIAIVFVAALGGVDAYFLLNWRLFRSLEREDWPAVAGFLEERIFRRGRILALHVRLLLNTYLVTSNTEGIRALEAWLAERKPRMIGRFSLQLGIPHLLAKDPGDAEAFFGSLLASDRVSERNWVRWNHAFSLLQMKSPEAAKAELLSLADGLRDPLLLLLSLYLLDVLAREDASLEERVTAGREHLKRRFTPQGFARRIEAAGGNMEVVVLSRLLQDATQWLFAAPAVKTG
jgi:hypothetical protein